MESLSQACVSVIIPCYRCSETIKRSVESVVGQTLPPNEVLLVEDGSNDGGATLSELYTLQRIFSDRNIKILTLNKNSGPANARNAGWDAATQPFVAFLDADDAWHPRKLEIQTSWMNEHPDVMISGHRIEVVSGFSPKHLKIRSIYARNLNQLEWLLSCRFSTISVMLRRDLPFRFDPEKRYSEDYLLWLRIVMNGNKSWRIELPLAYCFKPLYGSGGLSGDLWKMERGVHDTYQNIYREGLISFPVYAGLVIFSILKYFRRRILVFFRLSDPKRELV